MLSRIRLSTSSRDLFLECERKYQLVELLEGNERESHSAIFSFGHGWGDGVVEYLITGDLDAAVYRAWLSYWPHLEDITSLRLEEWCVQGLRQAQHKLDSIREVWEVAEFNGKPARELGFHIDINERFYWQSAMDAVLRHKRDSYLGVFECKHTFSYLDDITPMYKNSGQALGYSIVLDQIAQQPLASFPLHYFIGQWIRGELPKVTIHHYQWRKTLLDRLNWFLTLGVDVQRLQQLLDMGLFPMRGHSCLKYNKPCQFFGTCNLRSNDVWKTDEYFLKTKNAHIQEVEANIQFRFKLDDIVANHIQRIKEELGQ